MKVRLLNLSVLGVLISTGLVNGGIILTFVVASSDLSAKAEVVIPTEVSEPPYSVGDLVVEQGYYLDRGEGATRVNVRFEANRIHLYWIDENGLIAEPEAEKAMIRLLGSVSGQRFHQLTPLVGRSGLGSPTIMPPPHIYNMVLHIPASGVQGEMNHSFRYTADMSVPIDLMKKGDR